MLSFNRLNAATFFVLFVSLAPLTAGHGKEMRTAECALSDAAMESAIAEAETVIQTYIAYVEEKAATQQEYGFSVAVSVCGDTAWSASYGFADLEHRIPVTPETKFRVGSVSKSFTGIALGQLVEDGRLDLDDPIQTYVPDFPVKAHPVTVRQVAGHLGGIRHYAGEEFFSTTQYDTVTASLDIFEDDPLVNVPGTTFAYSTYGWNLLSAVVEGASGQTFLDYMDEDVFSLADMNDTLADENAIIIPHRTRFYTYQGDEKVVVNAPYVNNSNKWAGGGFLSTPTDMLRFGEAVLDGTLVQTETFEMMTASMKTNEGTQTGYGLGFFENLTPRELKRLTDYFPDDIINRTGTVLGDVTITGHSGGSVGGLTLFLMAPDTKGNVIVAATSNNSNLFPEFAAPVAAAFIAADISE